jgi:hypothetical protein
VYTCNMTQPLLTAKAMLANNTSISLSSVGTSTVTIAALMASTTGDVTWEFATPNALMDPPTEVLQPDRHFNQKERRRISSF